MPFLSRLYIKTALVYMAAALAIGVFSAATRAAGWFGFEAAFWPTYLHLFMLGWLTQLIFGVAFWLFPRHSRDRPFGSTWPVKVAYATLNAGLILRVVAEPGLVWLSGQASSTVLASSAVLQWVSVTLLAVYTWRRVRVK